MFGLIHERLTLPRSIGTQGDEFATRFQERQSVANVLDICAILKRRIHDNPQILSLKVCYFQKISLPYLAFIAWEHS